MWNSVEEADCTHIRCDWDRIQKLIQTVSRKWKSQWQCQIYTWMSVTVDPRCARAVLGKFRKSKASFLHLMSSRWAFKICLSSLDILLGCPISPGEDESSITGVKIWIIRSEWVLQICGETNAVGSAMHSLCTGTMFTIRFIGCEKLTWSKVSKRNLRLGKYSCAEFTFI